MKKWLLVLVFISSGNAFSCDEAAYRQFDFWLGEWRVQASEKLAGYSTIQRDLNGCVILEHYRTPSGYEGRSINIFDRQSDRWHQSWVDNAGLLLQLDGELQDGDMVLEGQGKDPQGRDIWHQIRWTPNADGTVRQLWRSKSGAGGEWQLLFDGLYSQGKEQK